MQNICRQKYQFEFWLLVKDEYIFYKIMEI